MGGGELLLGWDVEGRASCSAQGCQSKGNESSRKMASFQWLCWGVKERMSEHDFYRHRKENGNMEITSTTGRRRPWHSFSPP
jgi:hypothetical protein